MRNSLQYGRSCMSVRHSTPALSRDRTSGGTVVVEIVRVERADDAHRRALRGKGADAVVRRRLHRDGVGAVRRVHLHQLVGGLFVEPRFPGEGEHCARARGGQSLSGLLAGGDVGDRDLQVRGGARQRPLHRHPAVGLVEFRDGGDLDLVFRERDRRGGRERAGGAVARVPAPRAVTEATAAAARARRRPVARCCRVEPHEEERTRVCRGRPDSRPSRMVVRDFRLVAPLPTRACGGPGWRRARGRPCSTSSSPAASRSTAARAARLFRPSARPAASTRTASAPSPPEP